MNDENLRVSAPAVVTELRTAELGDLRRTKRLCVIAETWSAAPDCCVPTASKSTAKTEATYRLLNNEAVTYEPILEAHVRQTCERAAKANTVIVAHDTSEFVYEGEVRREGLGRLRSQNDQGFLGHTALAVTADGEKRPLGVLGLAPWVRTGAARRKKKNGTKRSGADYAKEKNKESARWFAMVKEVSEKVGDRASLVHVMDREADDYVLLWQLLKGGHRFVTRLYKDRIVSADEGRTVTESLRSALGRVEGICERDVEISRRAKITKPATSKTFPARDARTAKLQFSAATMQVKKPKYLKHIPDWLQLNVVHIRETEAPEGTEPIEWILVTSEPVATEADVLAVVEIYRTRWLIEELFKALKTGCAIEKRQHESLHSLLNALAICLPIAWQMLLMRKLARSTPEAPAEDVLTATQIKVLQVCTPIKLDARPTARQALYAVAALGGHLKSNGKPGWLTLGRGMEYLLALERGWVARDTPAMKCDP